MSCLCCVYKLCQTLTPLEYILGLKNKKNLFSYTRQIDIDMVRFSFQLLKNISFENRTDNFKEVSKSKKYMNFLQFISKRWLGYIIWIENFVNLSYLQL